MEVNVVKFKQQLIVDMQMQVRAVVNNELEQYKSKWLCPADVMTYLEDKYECGIEDSDTNGWEADAFYSVFINNKMFIIAGSGYYGGVTFIKEENDD